MDNRRLFLAAFLSLVLVIIWGRFVQKPPVRPPADAEFTEAAPSAAGPDASRSDEAGATGAAGESQTPAVASERPAAATPADGESPEGAEIVEPEMFLASDVEEEVVIGTERYRAVFTNRGAQLRSFALLKELDEAGNPLELVRSRGEGDAYPFAIVDPEGVPLFGDALFVVERQSGANGTVELTFSYRDGTRGAHERIVLDPNGLIDVEVEVRGLESWRVLLGPGIRDLDAEQMKNRLRQPTAAYFTNDDVETVSPSRQREVERLATAGLRWASLEDNYFLSAAVPESGFVGIEIRPVRQRQAESRDGRRFVSVLEADELQTEELAEVQALLLVPGGDTASYVGFFGAKRYQELSELPYGLENSVRWGFFGFLARPLYYGLRWIHERIPNYGWAIVIMTIIIKLVFFPLTHKGQKSMARMQELSPKIQQVRNRFKPKLKDKHGRPNREAQQAMNEELLALYRKEGVNPAGGCVPMLIQIPVFFAFFRLLQSAVELRNAPWIGWVHDLAAPDPWYLLPVMMLVTSLLLQRLTPAPPDPMQRRIIQMMPIIFSAVSVTFPAGLVLYWTTNNVLTMGQQWFYLHSRKKDAKTETKPSAGRGDRRS